MKRFTGGDFVGIRDFNRDDIKFLIELSRRLKEDQKTGRTHRLLEGKSLAGIFETPSTRTSISFETAMTHLGGHMMWLDQHRLWVGEAQEEDWRDTIKVISRYVDGIAYRSIRRERLDSAAEYSDIPVIDASSPLEHPTQALADVMTMEENCGDVKGCKVAMLWGYREANPPAGLPNSTMMMAAKMGFNLTIACPEGFDPDMDYMNNAVKEGERNGSKIEIVRSYEEAVKDADFINVYSWVSPEVFAEGLKTHFAGSPEFKKKKAALKDDWCVTKREVEMASKDVKIMHCLPVSRNNEVTDEVLDAPNSIIFDESENRLHTIKGVLAALLGGVNG